MTGRRTEVLAGLAGVPARRLPPPRQTVPAARAPQLSKATVAKNRISLLKSDLPAPPRDVAGSVSAAARVLVADAADRGEAMSVTEAVDLVYVGFSEPVKVPAAVPGDVPGAARALMAAAADRGEVLSLVEAVDLARAGRHEAMLASYAGDGADKTPHDSINRRMAAVKERARRQAIVSVTKAIRSLLARADAEIRGDMSEGQPRLYLAMDLLDIATAGANRLRKAQDGDAGPAREWLERGDVRRLLQRANAGA